MRVYFFLLFVAVPLAAFSQNLVPNPSFEQFEKCPSSYTRRNTGKFVPGWISPTSGTPDLFNECSKLQAGVPNNWAGQSKAHEGKGYAGIYAFMAGGEKGYREYLQTALTQPMEKGAKYLVQYYFKLASNSKYSIDRMGVLLSESANDYKDLKYNVFPVQATHEVILKSLYTRTTGTWIRFGYIHEAKGGERYLTIGNFSPNKDTKNFFIHFSQATEPMLYKAAYFFIDDVKVLNIAAAPPLIEEEKPLLLSADPSIYIDEEYVLKTVQFEFNKYNLQEPFLPELQKMVAILAAHPELKVEVNGHTDDVGTEAYNLTLSKNRAEAVANYFIAQGIDPARIGAVGFGKQQPLAAGDSETARATNRRVALKFVEGWGQ